MDNSTDQNQRTENAASIQAPEPAVVPTQNEGTPAPMAQAPQAAPAVASAAEPETAASQDLEKKSNWKLIAPIAVAVIVIILLVLMII